eukprot:SM000024S07748  [mRNA]  locus=s24:210500:214379:+ [translate_table: standard]
MEDDDDGGTFCLGPRCFATPHEGYVKPRYYPIPLGRGHRVPGRDWRWKVAVKLRTARGGDGGDGGPPAKAHRCSRLSILRGVALPQCLQLGDDGRWRWPWVPVSLLAGLKLDFWLPHHEAKRRRHGEELVHERSLGGGLQLVPSARIKVMTPVFGSLALRPSLELLPLPALTVKREFAFGKAQLTVHARLQADRDGSGLRLPRWSLQLDWRPADSARVFAKPEASALAVQYTRGFRISRDCRAVVAGNMEVPAKITSLEACSLSLRDLLPRKLRLTSLKIEQVIGTRGKRDQIPSERTYLQASHLIGQTDKVTVVPGHWIDPGFEPGAPGEREFNLEVANTIEKQLRGHKWDVLRPDRDAPHLSWEAYLNWVAKQTLRGVPVVEIHGQGSAADFRGLVLGVIGEKDAPLNRELASHFGFFPMDWRELAVPRRGGVIVECFNSDEVLQMAPWHRTWAVGRLSSRITQCILRATREKRASRGIETLDIDDEDLMQDESIDPQVGLTMSNTVRQRHSLLPFSHH